MPKIASYRKQAKLLLRWHRERNYSVGGRVRRLERYRHLGDAEVLDRPMPFALAQEIVAVETGFASWAALEAAMDGVPAAQGTTPAPARLTGVVPILFVRDVVVAADFYAAKLGFGTDFLHGKPPFYAAISRDGVCLHLRCVDRPSFAELAEREVSLILASIEVTNVKALFAEFERRGTEFAQRLVMQAWGGLDFQIRDPDGNRISFVEYRAPG